MKRIFWKAFKNITELHVLLLYSTLTNVYIVENTAVVIKKIIHLKLFIYIYKFIYVCVCVFVSMKYIEGTLSSWMKADQIDWYI